MNAYPIPRNVSTTAPRTDQVSPFNKSVNQTVNQSDSQNDDWEKEFHFVEAENVDPEWTNVDLKNPLNFADIRGHISDQLDLHDDFRLSLTCHHQRELFVKNQLKREFAEKQKEVHERLSSIWPIFNRNRSLEEPYVQHLIFSGELSVTDAENLTSSQLRDLVFLKEYIKRKEASVSKVLKLSPLQSKRLYSLPEKYFARLSIEHLALILNYSQSACFNQLLQPECLKLFSDELLTRDQFVQFPRVVQILLRSNFIKELYVKKQLDIAEIGSMNATQIDALNLTQSIILKKIITAREVLGAPEGAYLLAENQQVRNELITGQLTKDEVLKFTITQVKVLNNRFVRFDLDHDLLTIKDALGWNSDQLSVLNRDFLSNLKGGAVTAQEIVDKATLLIELRQKNKIFYYDDKTAHYRLMTRNFEYDGCYIVSPWRRDTPKDPSEPAIPKIIEFKIRDVIKSNPKAIRFFILDECYEWAKDAVKKGFFKPGDIVNLSDEKIALLYEPSVHWAMDQSILTFNEIRTVEDIGRLRETALHAYNSRHAENPDHSENCMIQ